MSVFKILYYFFWQNEFVCFIVFEKALQFVFFFCFSFLPDFSIKMSLILCCIDNFINRWIFRQKAIISHTPNLRQVNFMASNAGEMS